MKLFRILPLVVGSAAAGILVSTSPVHALDFSFSFTTTNPSPILPNISGTVTGIIYGLSDNTTGAASQIMLTSYPASFNTPVVPPVAFQTTFPASSSEVISNSFTVINGAISTANYQFQAQAPETDFQQFRLQASSARASNSDNTLRIVSGTAASYSAIVPFNIPGGATIPAFGGLLALGAMRKVRKSVASKTRIANPVNATVS